MNIVVNGNCDSTYLHDALRPATPGATNIDLRQMTFVTPIGLIAIMITAERAARDGDTVTLQRPFQQDPASYTSRIYHESTLDAYSVSHDLPAVSRRPRDTILELTRFDSGTSAQAFAQGVGKAVMERNKERGLALHDALSELGDNVTRHSKAGGGFAVAQEYKRPSRRLHFAVGDAGIGFRQALGIERTTDDVDAIKSGLRGMSSRDDGLEPGMGLQSIVDQVTALGGSLTVSSGRGHHRVGDHALSFLRPLGFEGSILEGVVPL